MPGWHRLTIRRGAVVHGHQVAPGISRHACSRRSKPSLPDNRALQAAALAGLVGDQALPFLEYRETLNLPDPEDILKDPRSLVLPDRTDRAYAVCYSLVGAVLNNKTPERWQSALIALGVACRKNADIPTAAARTLCDKRNRPEGSITVAGRVPAVL